MIEIVTKFSNKIEQVRVRLASYMAFVGSSCVLFLSGSILNGLMLFFVEFAFAYLFQAFLTRVGAMSIKSVSLPDWLAGLRLSAAMGLICLVGALKGGLYWLQDCLQGAAVEGFKFRVRARLLDWAINSRSVSGTKANSIFGEQITSASMGIRAIQVLILQLTISLLFFVVLTSMSPLTTVPAVILLGLLLIPSRVISRKIRRLGQEVIKEWDHTNTRLQMSIKNLLLIQIYGTQRFEETFAIKSLRGYYSHMLKVYWLGGVNNALNQIISVGAICIMTLPVVFNTQRMAPGLRLSYFYLFLRFIYSLTQISIQLPNISVNWQAFVSLAEWWKQTSLQKAVASNQGIAHKSTIMDVDSPIWWKVTNMSFAYPGSSKAIIENVSISIKPGEVVAILGPSGVGKSTLLGLLLGTLSPTKGTIDFYCGEKKLTIPEFRAFVLPVMGYVGPDSFMFEGTIEQNLTYGLSRIPTGKEFTRALDLAQCGFVWELAGGLDFQITDQSQGLSAGQKQRLALARALLRRPKALILDEATSNLDFETEQRLLETFHSLKGQVTIIAATHRQALANIANHHISLEFATPHGQGGESVGSSEIDRKKREETLFGPVAICDGRSDRIN